MRLSKLGKHGKIVLWTSAAAVLMFGFSWIMVPLYDVFCQVVGIDRPASRNPVSGYGIPIDESRLVTVQLTTTLNGSVEPGSLDFSVPQELTMMQLNPGVMQRVDYYVKNNTDQPIKVQAIPSVTPGLAGGYLQKTECFCFNSQALKPGESMPLPMQFFLDPELPSNIHTVTLSYTLFDITNNG